MTSDTSLPPLSIETLHDARAGARIGCTLHYFDSVDSTNTVAHRLATDGAAEGTVVIADSQTKGRGRLGRSWVSPPRRNLYMSVILRPAIVAGAAPPLSLVAGVAVAETIRDWTPRAVLKWPNDVLIDRRKVSGVLTEMEADDGWVRFVIVGIGVNINSTADDFPAELRDTAVSLRDIVGAPVDRTAFAESLLSRLEQRYDQFLHGGFVIIRPVCERLSGLTGQHVQVDDGAHRYAGLVTGIAANGSLCLRDATGRDIEVLVGDVSIINTSEGPTER